MDHETLQTLWFLLISVLFTGFFVLEGFDFRSLGDPTRQDRPPRSLGFAIIHPRSRDRNPVRHERSGGTARGAI